MNHEADTDTLDITFTSIFAWMLIIFGVIFCCLGVVFMLPFMPRNNVPLGITISVISLAGITGGWLWRRHLPVVMRLTADELQVRGSHGGTFRWLEMERVDFRSIHVKGEVQYVCIKLTPEAAVRRASQSSGTAKTVKKLAMSLTVGNNYDLVLHGQTFAAAPSWLVQEFQRRISLAAAREYGSPKSSPPDSSNVQRQNLVRDESQPVARREMYVRKLGPVVEEFSPSLRGLIRSIACSVGCFAIVAAALTTPVWIPPQPGDETLVWCFFGFFAAVFALLGMLSLWPRSFSRRRFIVCRDGLEIHEAGHIQAYPWASILGVERDVEETLTGRYLVDILELPGGKKVDVDPFRVRHAGRLIEHIAGGFGPLLARKINEQLCAGRIVAYGVLALTAQGIQAGHDLLPWHSLVRLRSGVKPDDPILVQLTDDQIAVIEIRSEDVPNLEMLTPLIGLRAAGCGSTA